MAAPFEPTPTEPTDGGLTRAAIGLDLSDLLRRMRDCAMRQDRRRRQAVANGFDADAPNTCAAVADIDEDARSLAEAERVLSIVHRFLKDKGHAAPRSSKGLSS